MFLVVPGCASTGRQPARPRRHQGIKGHAGVETRRTLNINSIPHRQNMPFRPSLRPMNNLATNSMEYLQTETPTTQRTIARDEEVRIDYRHPNRPALVRKDPKWFSGHTSPWNRLTHSSTDLDFE